mmetsp:Transcript_39323/g.53335  ORF Transcript_39323/g.53335 Transcript_39323/m.53335 type:complete len:80 (-) Transcript_39323:540-779(-)
MSCLLRALVEMWCNTAILSDASKTSDLVTSNRPTHGTHRYEEGNQRKHATHDVTGGGEPERPRRQPPVHAQHISEPVKY